MPNSTYLEHLYNTRPFGWQITEPTEMHYFSFEFLDPFWWHDFLKTRYYYAIYAAIAYMTIIFGLQSWMRNRAPFNLKTPLFLWNFGLGIFSIFGFFRYLPGFMIMMSQPNALYNSICVRRDLTVPVAYWSLMFAISKFVELGDTVFLLLRKKPLKFLQWYHHLVTMAVTWILAPYLEPVTRWYVFLNFGVHSLMYPYFALKVLHIKVPNQVANLITTLQLAQMMFGLFVNCLTIYYKQIGVDCFRYPISIKAFSFVYGTFFILFGKLFYDAVLKKGSNREKKVE